MCTVSFLPVADGYALLMNRDEQRTRVRGLPPGLAERQGRRVLSPSEPGGGTWVAANDAGASWALVNWYSIPKRDRGDSISRGKVVRTVATSVDAAAAQSLLDAMPLRRMNPFRLIAVFPGSRQVFEWRWNNEKLLPFEHPWALGHWISSGFDEPQAERIRGATFKAAHPAPGVDALTWLRGMHRSHLPQTGPFSICMHRTDAVTVSHTEITVSGEELRMNYQDGSPCESGRRWRASLRRCPNRSNGVRIGP